MLSDLVVLAFQCDVTRVATFMMEDPFNSRSFSFLGVSGNHHNISHHGGAAADGNVGEAAFSDGSFDAVTLNHVLEHALDPVSLLRECWRVTARGGRLVVITPNVESLGCRSWGAAWYHLDPPRHLFLFAPRTLAECASRVGITLDLLRTSTRLAWQTASASRLIAETGQAPPARRPPRSWALHGALFQLMEEGAALMSSTAGEELLMIATKPQRTTVVS
jgi:SAM-dependent methyltransferase